MSIPTNQQCVLFPEASSRPLRVEFSAAPASSDGGAILLDAAEKRVHLLKHLASQIPDRRHQSMIEHTYLEMLRQRVFGIGSGWEDCNDAGRLRKDPVHRLVVAGDPRDDHALSSQPTLSRLENVVDLETLRAMERAMIVTEVLRHAKRVGRHTRHVTIEADWTDDAVHGTQEGATYNSYYGHTCYRTLLVHARFGNDPERYLIGARLLGGTGSVIADVREMLFWALSAVEAALPRARAIVCLDAGFQHDGLIGDLERRNAGYTIGIAGNARLAKDAHEVVRAATERARAGKRGALAFGETTYQAATWSCARRVIIKADVDVADGTLPIVHTRFVVTNLRTSPRHVYRHIYAPRGDEENRIKEIKLDLALGRTSCHTMPANQFRVFLSAAAHILMQEIRRAARGTVLARAQVRRLRDTLVKIGATVVASVRRLRLILPASAPFAREWILIAKRLDADVE